MKKIYVNVTLILAVVLFTLSACTTNKFVGTWQDSQTGESIEFYKDGTVTFNSSLFSTTGTYTVVDDSSIRVDFTGLLALAGSQVWDYSFSGKTLTLNINGVEATYTKQ
jgi:hypothetical protein